MEVHLPEINIDAKDINIKCEQIGNEDVKNENLGHEMMRKSVSWAKDEVLVETREIEACHGKKFSLRILDRLCCVSKPGNEKSMDGAQTAKFHYSAKGQNCETGKKKNRLIDSIEKFGANYNVIGTAATFEKKIKKGCVRKMAEYSCSENQSIKDSVKSLKKYGSTCNHIKRLDYYVTHVIQKTDTLQGLALKYNTTTEQIRRINRLFASDSLFLRDQLKIPVTRELANSYETNNFHSGSVSDTITSSVSTDSFTDEDEKSINDLFGKIDNSIASARAQVKQVQEHSSFLDSANTTGMLSKKNNKKPPHSSSVNSNNDVFVTPHPVVLNRGRKVKSSLQRLEKEQDELFEL